MGSNFMIACFLFLSALMCGVPAYACLVVPYAYVLILYVRIMKWKLDAWSPVLVALFLFLMSSWGVYMYQESKIGNAILSVSFLCALLACIPRRFLNDSASVCGAP